MSRMPATAADIEARAADWLAERDRHGDAWSVERRAALAHWLAESTANRVAFLRLQAGWQRADRLGALRAPSPAAAPARASPWSWLRGLRLRGLAGGLVAAAAAATLGWFVLAGRGGLDSEHGEVYAAARGARQAVALADGSHLTLNTSTRVRVDFSGPERHVWLDSGEAFFDVAHDARRPFVITAGPQRITVLGTRFSVQREGERLKVVVLEGRVQVQNTQAANARATVLARDDTALSEPGSVLVGHRTPQQVSDALSWMQGKLVFDQVRLDEAARQFNRYGDKQLVIEDAAAAQIVIGGVFDADNVEAFARLLGAGFGLKVQTVGSQIRVGS